MSEAPIYGSIERNKSAMRTFAQVACLALLLVAVAGPSRAQQTGDFRFKYGFDTKTRPRHEDQGSASRKAATSFKIYLTPRASVTFANNNVVSKEKADGTRVTGFGNSSVTFDIDVINEDTTGVRSRPSLSFEYNMYLPTGSKSKGLGTGKVDHEIIGAVSKSFGDSIISGGEVVKRTNVEADLGGYFAGNPDRSGFTTVGELVLGITHTIDSLSVQKYTYHGEINMSSAAKDTLSEIYALNQLGIALPSGAVFRIGMRNGITPNSPRFAIFSSITFKGSFRKK
jgi:hypothetical protein